MDIKKGQKICRIGFCCFCVLCLFLLGMYFYLLHRRRGLNLVEIIIPLFFFCLVIGGAYGTLKYGMLVFTNRFIDRVTGGPNEFIFQQEFERRTVHEGKQFAFLYINIKKFSVLNSEYGWKTGDHILKLVYEALKGQLKDGERIVRVSTDTYYLLLQVSDEEELYKRIYELDDAVYFMENTGIDQKLFLSVGAYILDEENDTYANAVDRADFCRTQSEDVTDGNTHFEIYNYTLHDKRERYHYLQEKAPLALEKEHFKMYLQPKYEMKHETLSGAEALVRWEDPEEGMMPLYEFMPLFEKNGFIRKIDYLIFESALKLIESWIEEGIQPVCISVNLSRSHFTDTDFFENSVLPIFERHKVPKKYIEFEISENTMLDNSGQLIKFVQDLQKQGFTCSMDDFGSGYSSLNTMKSLPVSTVKLDRKMFSEEDKEKGKIVSSGIIKIARELHMKVVAEGVETKEYVDFLKEQKCDEIQGYYFGKPMPAEDFDALLRASRKESNGILEKEMPLKNTEVYIN